MLQTEQPGQRLSLETAEDFARAMLALQTEVISARGDMDVIIPVVVEGALRMIGHADGALIAFRDGEFVVGRAASGNCIPLLGAREPIDRSLVGRTMTAGTPLHCTDSETDSRVDRSKCRSMGLRSIVIMPIPYRGGHEGILFLDSSRPHAFNRADLLTVELLVAIVSAGLARRAQTQAATAQAMADRRFAATFEQAAVGMAHVSPAGDFLLVNDRFCAIAGYSRKALLAGGFQRITHPDDLDADLAHVKALLDGDEVTYAMEKRYVRGNGAIVWVNLTVSLVRRPDGAPEFFVAVIEDISARRHAERAARHDSLTGLLNRRGLLDELDRMMARQRIGDPGFAVLVLDLDGFKGVNDRFGHAEGDHCLTAVADSIGRIIRGGDRLARLGGDEFVLLMPAHTGDMIETVLARLQEAVAAAGQDAPWSISASVGAVMVPGGSTSSATHILAQADRLMYRAKRAPTERCEVVRIE